MLMDTGGFCMGSHVRGEKNSDIKGMNINTGTSACNDFYECHNLKIQINNNTSGISKREVRQRNVTMHLCDELLGSLPRTNLL